MPKQKNTASSMALYAARVREVEDLSAEIANALFTLKKEAKEIRQEIQTVADKSAMKNILEQIVSDPS